jgi:TRAP transporter TAXI family solute receptor
MTVVTPDTDEGPSIHRSLRLNFMGDWGHANFHRILGYLGMHMLVRSGPQTKFAIWNGDGFAGNLRAVASGEVDVTITTPASWAAMATGGIGPYSSEPMPELRALAVLPHRDRVVFTVRADTGIASFADLREHSGPLRIATSSPASTSYVGLAVDQVLRRSGVEPSQLEARGGKLLFRSGSWECIKLLESGAADAVFHEAMMTPPWLQMTKNRPMNFLAVEEAVLDEVWNEYRWPRATIPTGQFEGVDEPVPTIDFSDWLVLCRSDMPDDVAHLLTWALVAQRAGIDKYYEHIPVERSPLWYPIDPRAMSKTTIDLHPGAAQLYQELGFVDD